MGFTMSTALRFCLATKQWDQLLVDIVWNWKRDCKGRFDRLSGSKRFCEEMEEVFWHTSLWVQICLLWTANDDNDHHVLTRHYKRHLYSGIVSPLYTIWGELASEVATRLTHLLAPLSSTGHSFRSFQNSKNLAFENFYPWLPTVFTS